MISICINYLYRIIVRKPVRVRRRPRLLSRRCGRKCYPDLSGAAPLMRTPQLVRANSLEQTALVRFATPPPPSQRGEGVRGREEDSAFSRIITFISQKEYTLYCLLRIRMRVYNPCPFITGASYLSQGFL